MQKLVRQRTMGGRVQMPPTMQQGMTHITAPLSPNVLAEPYKCAAALLKACGCPPMGVIGHAEGPHAIVGSCLALQPEPQSCRPFLSDPACMHPLTAGVLSCLYIIVHILVAG